MGVGDIISLLGVLAVVAASLGTVTWRLVWMINAAEGRANERAAVVDQKRSDNTRDLYTAIERVAASLDTKFNRVRDDQILLAREMVRREDMKEDIARIERSQEATLSVVSKLRDDFNSAMIEWARK